MKMANDNRTTLNGSLESIVRVLFVVVDVVVAVVDVLVLGYFLSNLTRATTGSDNTAPP